MPGGRTRGRLRHALEKKHVGDRGGGERPGYAIQYGSH